MVLTGLVQGVKQCGCNQTALNQFESVQFAQCGQAFSYVTAAAMGISIHEVLIFEW